MWHKNKLFLFKHCPSILFPNWFLLNKWMASVKVLIFFVCLLVSEKKIESKENKKKSNFTGIRYKDICINVIFFKLITINLYCFVRVPFISMMMIIKKCCCCFLKKINFLIMTDWLHFVFLSSQFEIIDCTFFNWKNDTFFFPALKINKFDDAQVDPMMMIIIIVLIILFSLITLSFSRKKYKTILEQLDISRLRIYLLIMVQWIQKWKRNGDVFKKTENNSLHVLLWDSN